MTINNINDVAKWFGSESADRLEHDIYKYTACGAWINWNEESVTIGSIVEGSDAEFSKRFDFPITSEALDSWLEELEQLTDEAWIEANDTVEYILRNGLYEAAVSLMDNDIREELSNELAPCSEREFLEAYMERHEEKFNSVWIFN